MKEITFMESSPCLKRKLARYQLGYSHLSGPLIRKH